MQLEENIAHIGPSKQQGENLYLIIKTLVIPIWDLMILKSYMEQGCIDEAVGISLQHDQIVLPMNI